VYLDFDLHKGRGIYAQEDIPAGTRIVRESPLYFFDQKKHLQQGVANCPICSDFFGSAFPDFFTAEIEKLEPASFHLVAAILLQPRYFQLLMACLTPGSPDPSLCSALALTLAKIPEHTNAEYLPMLHQHLDAIFSRILSNCHVSSDPIGAGLFPVMSQFNHDCDNNCSFWSEAGQMVAVTQRNVSKGEELTISYITDTYRDFPTRQKHIEWRGFQCRCARCQTEKNQPVKEKYRRYLQLEKQLDEGCIEATDQLVAMNEELRGATDPENIWLFENQADFYRDQGDLQKAQQCNEKALAIAQVIFGQQSIRLAKYQMRVKDPFYKQEEQ